MARTRWAPGAAALAQAAGAVSAIVHDGRSAEAALAAGVPDAQRPAVRAITLGTVRWYLRLAPALEPLLARPKLVAAPVRALLVAAAHQVEYSRNAPEYTVHAAVDAARALRYERASGLVNAVLRRFVRERRQLLAAVDVTTPGRTAHPGWLVQMLQEAWPAQAGQVLDASNEHPPMTLRVDLTRVDRADYLARLGQLGIAASAPEWAPAAVCLAEPVAIERLPGFADGLASVQDAAAQLAAPLLGVRPGMRILDACAAPGGKTGHLLEMLGAGAEVVAIDVDAARARRIEENLRRLRRDARVEVADVRSDRMLGGIESFDRVLVDAPCSGTGVIRRHPDIKLLRRPSDIPAFAREQLAILRAAARRVTPGGRLVYATCSILPAENAAVVRAALALEPTLKPVATGSAVPPGAVSVDPGFQLLPGGPARSDGFYYACLEKTTVSG